MTGSGFPRASGFTGALALALAPVAAEAAAAPVVCPDAATVQAARLVEFQTMMMGVAVRCRHVGVPIGDHLEGMNGARRTMFAGANERVATYLRSLTTKPPPGSTPPAAPATSAPPAPAQAAKPAPGKAITGKSITGRAIAGRAAPGKRAPVARAVAAAPSPSAKAPTNAALAAATPTTPYAKPAARISRRTDPYDRYLTMIGNQYGAGITTLQRCKAFDAIVLSLADKANTDRLLTMVSSSLVQVTLLEAIVNCPPGKK